MPKTRAADPEAQPGYYIRRLQQIAVAIFLEETEGLGVTPVQFAVLQTAHGRPGLDQRSLAASVGFDTSTLGGVVDRLEARGLLRREIAPDDRRVRRLFVTPDGEALLDRLVPAMLKAQKRILQPLPPDERDSFFRMLKTLVQANNGRSRAPREG